MTDRAVTRRIDGGVDLLDVAGADGVVFARGTEGLAGRGVAATVDVDGITPESIAAVQRALAERRGEDEVDRPGTGPVAFVSLPFEPGGRARFIIPSEVVGVDDDWCRDIADRLAAEGIRFTDAQRRRFAAKAKALPSDPSEHKHSAEPSSPARVLLARRVEAAPARRPAAARRLLRRPRLPGPSGRSP